MSAYFVAIKIETNNQDELDIYAQKAGSTLHGHAATPKTLNGSIRNTDGVPVEGALIIEFPSFKEAEIWNDSPAYQEAVVHRFAGAKYTTFIIEGV